MPVRLSLSVLSSRYDPFEHEVWGTPVTVDDVRQALAERRLAAAPGGSDHAARIAYLVENPASDPVSIDVGVPSLGCAVSWPVVDGNHRVAAAIYRQDETVLAEVSGEVAYACHLFGASCVEGALAVSENPRAAARPRRAHRQGVKKSPPPSIRS